MSIFGDRNGQGSFEDARRNHLGQYHVQFKVCGTCEREIFPSNSLPGYGYRRENYCQCVKVQTPQEAR